MSFVTTVATTREDLDRLEGPWRDLEAQRPRWIYQRFEPAQAFAAAYADQWRPLVVMVERGEERALVGLAQGPDGRLAALGAPVLPYADPIASSEDALAALADATCEAIGDLDLDVGAVRGDSLHLGFWRRILAADRDRAALASVGFAHAVLLRQGTSKLFAGHPSARKDIRALESRFAVRHREVEPEARAAALEWMLTGPTRRRRGAPLPRHDLRRAAYLRAIVAALPPEMVSIRALDVRDEPVAMILGLEYRGIWSTCALGVSGELSRYAPETGCLYRTMGWAAERGLVELDLMEGDQPFKARWADVRRPLLRLMRGAPALEARHAEPAIALRA